MRILHMTPPIVNNGVYKYIFNNWEYIDQDNFRFSFLMQAPEELKKTEEWKKYRFEIRSFSIPQRVDPERFRREIYDILSDNYDIIHLHTSYWRGFMIEEIAMELGIPKVIVHSHSTSIDQIDSEERAKQLEEHERLKALFSLKYATDFLACSKLAADWLYNSSIPRDKIKIFHNAIDTKKFKFNSASRRVLRQRLGLEDLFVIGNIGRYEYQKNQEFLLDVFSYIHQEYPKTKLILIGEGRNKAKLEKSIFEYGLEENVELVDWQDNVEDWYSAFDLFCLPSRFEGLPITVVEAQAAGLPCLVSDSVTDEIEITPLVKRIPLITEEWANVIKNNLSSGLMERGDYTKELKLCGYDIEESAKKLMELWS